MYSSTAYILQSSQGKSGKHGKQPGSAEAVQPGSTKCQIHACVDGTWNVSIIEMYKEW